jgi:nucleotide-binding universal stress UspA family protein
MGAAYLAGIATSFWKPGDEIRLCADLIVMCSHGHSGLRHLLSGSNAQQLVGCGTISVLQIRPPGEGSEASFSCSRILVPLDGRPEHEEGLEAAARLARYSKGVIPSPQELSLVRKDGTRVPVEIRMYLVDLEGRRLVLGIARDMSERKRAEEALRESEAKFREAIRLFQRFGFLKRGTDGHVLRSFTATGAWTTASVPSGAASTGN